MEQMFAMMANYEKFVKYMLPLHLAMILTAFPLQVYSGKHWVALFAYFPMIFIFSYVFCKAKSLINLIDWVDFAISIAVSIVFFRSMYFYFIYEDINILKHVIFFVCAFFCYIYVRYFSDEETIRNVFLAISIVGFFVGLHWIFDSYQRTVNGVVLDYSYRMLNFILSRNNFVLEQVNTSVYGSEYRSYGIFSKHSVTGAVVVLATLAALSQNVSRSYILVFMIYILGGFTMFVGMATLALGGYFLVTPIFFIRPCTRWILDAFARWAVAFSGLVSLVTILIMTDTGFGVLLKDRLNLLAVQFRFLGNFSGADIDTGKGTINTSFVLIWRGEASTLSQYLLENPIVFWLGDGFAGVVGHGFPRGGDLALSEVLVTFGAPALLSLGAVATYVFWTAIRSIYRQIKCLDGVISPYSLFSAASLVFLAISTIHYNVIFLKEILPILAITLALPLANKRLRGNRTRP
jgi:hypothetical protein